MSTTAYDIAVRLSMETSGFNSAGMLAMRLFGDLESKAKSADAAVAKLAQTAGQSSSAFIAQAQAAGQTIPQIDAMTAAHERLSQAMSGVALLAGGAVLTGVGLGMFGFLKNATDQAEQLQVVMTQIKEATNATPDQMATLQKLAVDQGLRTQFSLNDEASIIAAMTQAGIAGPGSVGRIQQMLPAVNNFDELMKMTRGAGTQESTTTAIELAHLYGQYDALSGKNGPGVNYMIDLAGRALSVTPGSQTEFLTTLSQMAGQMRPLYGDNRTGFINDSIALAMLEAQLGQQGRGGTQIASMLGRTLGSAGASMGTRTSAQDRALSTLSKDAGGLSFFDKNGQFAGMSQFLSILELAAAKDHNPAQVGELFKSAFGAIGIRQAGVLADPITVAQFAKIGASLDPKTGLPNTAKQREDYNNSAEGQAAKAAANWSTLTTIIGTRFVPIMATASGAVAGVLGLLDKIGSSVPLLATLGSAFIALTATVVTFSGVVMMGVGALRLMKAAALTLKLDELLVWIKGLSAAQMLATVQTWALTAAQTAGAVASRAAAVAAGVLDGVVMALSGGYGAAAVAAGVLDAATGAGAAVAGGAAAVWGILSGAVDVATASFIALDIAAAPFVVPLLAIVAVVGTAIYVFTHWTQVSKLLGDMFSWMGGKLHDFLVMLGLVHDGPPKAQVVAPGAPVDSSNESTYKGQRGHWISGYRSAPHFVPDATQPKPHKGHGATGGGGGLHIHAGAIKIEVSGVPSHQAKRVGQDIGDQLADRLYNHWNRSGLVPTTLKPRL